MSLSCVFLLVLALLAFWLLAQISTCCLTRLRIHRCTCTLFDRAYQQPAFCSTFRPNKILISNKL